MTVGVLGAGQLGRMLALAGYPLGLRFLFLDRSGLPTAPGDQVGPAVRRASPPGAARELGRSEVVTFDWENVPVETSRRWRTRTASPAAARALAVAAQDRLHEKTAFQRAGHPDREVRGGGFDAADLRARARRRWACPAC
jgi:5-(carboxyamino)imidazole ribonucleotide synthase